MPSGLCAIGPLALPTGKWSASPRVLGSTILPALPGGLPLRHRAAGFSACLPPRLRPAVGANLPSGSVDVEIVELEVHLKLFLGRFVKLSCIELLEWA